MSTKNARILKILKMPEVARLARSQALWRGFAIGLSPHRYLCSECDVQNDLFDYLNRDDSFIGAWQSVGDLLTDALNQFDPHGETRAETEERSSGHPERARADIN
jgi:hypothetical protein